MAFHEINSFKPILHIHYDHHFKESPQFADLEVVLNELYSTFQDYLEILYTDCEQDKCTYILMQNCPSIRARL